MQSRCFVEEKVQVSPDFLSFPLEESFFKMLYCSDEGQMSFKESLVCFLIFSCPSVFHIGSHVKGL